MHLRQVDSYNKDRLPRQPAQRGFVFNGTGGGAGELVLLLTGVDRMSERLGGGGGGAFLRPPSDPTLLVVAVRLGCGGIVGPLDTGLWADGADLRSSMNDPMRDPSPLIFCFPASILSPCRSRKSWYADEALCVAEGDIDEAC